MNFCLDKKSSLRQQLNSGLCEGFFFLSFFFLAVPYLRKFLAEPSRIEFSFPSEDQIFRLYFFFFLFPLWPNGTVSLLVTLLLHTLSNAGIIPKIILGISVFFNHSISKSLCLIIKQIHPTDS